MKAYIINLKKSVDRKKYMQEQLEKMFFLSAEFVEAVDARGMTEREKNVFFDTELFCKRYVKEVRPGEIMGQGQKKEPFPTVPRMAVIL